MKSSASLFLTLAAGLVSFAGAGCAHLSTSPGGDPNRVIVGTVNYGGDGLPADAEVVVRLLDTSGGPMAKMDVNKNLPVVDRPRPELPPQVLGEQTIRSPEAGPVAFRIEYTADDRQLLHGLNLEARISYGGRVQKRTVTMRAVTPGNASDMHEVWVESVAR